MSEDSVLLTGSSGMIGTALAVELHGSGYDLTCVDRVPNRWSKEVDDLTVQGDLREAATTTRLPSEIDTVVHLAARSRVPQSIEDPSQATENVELTQQALEYARSSGASEFLLASSREVYGEPAVDEVDESCIDLSAVKNPYGASKLGSEALAAAYESTYGIDTASVRLSNVYGRYDTSDRVVPTFVARALRDDELVVYGSGKVLDFLYLDDCVRGMVVAIERPDVVPGHAVNLGSGTGTTLVDLAETVVAVTDSRSDVRVESTRGGEVERFVADISRARETLGFEPVVDLRGGIERAVRWYRACDEPFGDE